MVSLIEVPVLNQKYWAKIPEVDADGIMLDLEDSATPENKAIVRERIVQALDDVAYFGGRRIIVRCNNLNSPWGVEDLMALGGISADFVISYPKVESADELDEIVRILEAAGHKHPLHVMIETGRALLEIERIAAHPAVVGLHFGYVDFAADIGSKPFDSNGGLSAVSNGYARSRIAVTAAAYGLFATGGSLIPDYKDLDKVRDLVQSWSNLGFTACIAVSPTHLPIINEVMRPTEAEVTQARAVCVAYDAAVYNGDPAAVLHGRVITHPDYRVAKLLLDRVTTG
ncbi:HpcH/HpaI aldolase/citrate lyase family protein [Arthrobacter sp. MA-N2]|uniref:HpcH/HpaI aldolase/citrate lyase family protein n=1 Tax=Arthrobacter sp. MA-N2 TaxID=1101188 RepID=UPI0004AFECBF|nr:CoA ester lyase [Arthrobacter sp. MA-N2]